MGSGGEAERIAALKGLAILDTPPEARFDHLTDLATFTFKVPIALISLIDEERQWFKSRVGLTLAETEREIQHIRTRAEAEIESSGKSERVALQRYAAQLALEMAETKVRARLNPDTDAALVQAFIGKLGDNTTLSQNRN